METQTKQILQWMRKNPITPMEALQFIGSFRLAARIKELREEGHEIHTEMVFMDESSTRFASYILIKEKKKLYDEK